MAVVDAFATEVRVAEWAIDELVPLQKQKGSSTKGAVSISDNGRPSDDIVTTLFHRF